MIDLLDLFGAEVAPTVPVELTALAALVGIVWWLVKRSDTADKARDDELAQTRRDMADERKMHALELAAMNQKLELHRAEKHRTINDLSAARGALQLVDAAMASCECDSLELIAPLVKKILTQGGHPE